MTPSRARRRPDLRVRPRLEPLEDRAVPSAGDLDTSFGTGGRVNTSFGGTYQGAQAVLVQPDHKIVVAGYADTGAGTSFDFALARYNSDGNLDPTFGTNGRATTDFFGGYDSLTGAVLQPDGKIVVSGVVYSGTAADLGMARYNPNGTLDTTFGTGGRVTIDFFQTSENGGYLALMPDGRLVVAGYASDGDTSYTVVARYNPDGTPDAEFDADGKAAAEFDGRLLAPRAVAVQRDGRVIVAGSVFSPPGVNDFALARFRPDGAPDPAFGSGGRVVTDIGATNDQALALALQPNGRVLAAGLTGGFSPSDPKRLAVVRYLPNGSLDTSFSFDGKVALSFPAAGGTTAPVAVAYAVAPQPDGKIVAAGYAGPSAFGPIHFAAARLRPDGSLDRAFGANGQVVTPFGTGSVVQALAVQDDGGIVAAGYAEIQTDDFNETDFALVRYRGDGPNIVVAGADANIEPRVRVYDAATGVEKFSFLAYPAAFRGGVRVAAGDVNGDGTPDIITAPGPGAERLVKVFDGKTGTQLAGALSSFTPFSASFARGVYVATGDVTGDGLADVIVGTGNGSGSTPRVKVWNPVTGTFAYNFLAFGPTFAGGVRVAAGDVTGDGRADIVAATGPGGMPLVRVFDGATGLPLAGRLGRFLAGPVGFRGGLFVSAGDVDGDNLADLIVGVGADRATEPRVTVYYANGIGSVSLLAFDSAFRGGVRVATADVNADGREDIVVGAGGGTGLEVRVFDGVTRTLIDDFAADDFDLTHGVFVAGSRPAVRPGDEFSPSVPG